MVDFKLVGNEHRIRFTDWNWGAMPDTVLDDIARPFAKHIGKTLTEEFSKDVKVKFRFIPTFTDTEPRLDLYLCFDNPAIQFSTRLTRIKPILPHHEYTIASEIDPNERARFVACLDTGLAWLAKLTSNLTREREAIAKLGGPKPEQLPNPPENGQNTGPVETKAPPA